jgi:acetyl esterase/lipase
LFRYAIVEGIFELPRNLAVMHHSLVFIRRLLLRIVAVSVATCAVAMLRAAPIPASVLFQRPPIGHAAISPDGTAVAMLAGGKDQFARLIVLDLTSMKPQVVASFKNNAIGRFAWTTSQRLVFQLVPNRVDFGRVDVGSGLFAVDRDGGRFRQLVEVDNNFVKDPSFGTAPLHWSNYLYRVPSGADGKGSDFVLLARAAERSDERVGFLQLTRVNTVNGTHTEIEVPPNSIDFAIDEMGQIRAAHSQLGASERILLPLPDRSWKTVAEFGRREGKAFPRFAFRDRLYSASETSGYWQIVESPVDRLPDINAAPVVRFKDFDSLVRPIVREQNIVGWRGLTDANVTIWSDPEWKALQAKIDARLQTTNNHIQIPQAGGDSPFVLITAESDRHPTQFLLYDRRDDKLSSLGTIAPGIVARDAGRTEFLRFDARDGRRIPALVTRPPSSTSPAPAVILVHGGPWVRGASWGWHPEVQFLASRGYAVIQPEFRGSTGFGSEHFRAGWKQWGQAMQDDLVDAARWAEKTGVAASGRVCIMGASYGGYATLMGLIRDPDVFRCGVAWAAVSDPLLLFSRTWGDIANDIKRYDLPQMLGDPNADAAMFKRIAPLENAEKLKRPLLLAHGGWDQRVPMIHGTRMRDALRANGATSIEWISYPEEGHGWSKPETNIDFWERTERFLRDHLVSDH